MFSIFLLFVVIRKCFNKTYSLKYYNYIYSSNNNINNSLIITSALNFNISNFLVFIESLQKTGFSGITVVFTFSLRGTETKYLFSKEVDVIELSRYYPFYPSNHLKYPISSRNLFKYLHFYKGKSFVTYRYFIYKLFIKYYGKYFSNIFITDIRDVIFQENPFKWNIESGIYLVEEHPKITIGKDLSNKIYLKNYNPNKRIYQNSIINGGTIYGTYPYILHFLSELLTYICSFGCNSNDQGGINSYVRSINLYPFPLFILNSSHTPVKTIALWINHYSKCCLPVTNFILNEDKSIPNVVHQYDRIIKRNKNNSSIIELLQKYIYHYTH